MAAWRKDDKDPQGDRWPHNWPWWVWVLIVVAELALVVYVQRAP